MIHPTAETVQDRFYELRQQLGDTVIVDALTGYLPTDDVPEFNLWDFSEWLERLYQ